jgi:predicted PurR-regulated permease PerM
MDHQDSEQSSEIKTDLSSNQAEKSAKTIHQQNLEKDVRNKVSRRHAYSLAAISMVVLLIVVLVLPVVIQETDEPIQQIEDSQSQTDQLTIDREILAQKPIAQAMFSELLIKIDEIKLFGSILGRGTMGNGSKTSARR